MLVDLTMLARWYFDVIQGMHWLATYHTLADYHRKNVNFQILDELEFNFIGNMGITPPHIISVLQVEQMLRKGCNLAR